MPFGSFHVVNSAATAEQKQNPPAKQAPPVCRNFRICLVARNLAYAQDYLCSMYENAAQALAEVGFAFFVSDLATISDIIAKKKALDMHFWEGTEFWSCTESETPQSVYSFGISAAGRPEQAMTVEVRCVGASAYSAASADCSCVWFLTDGVLFEDHLQADPYLKFLRSAVANSKKPACLIVGQTEHWNRNIFGREKNTLTVLDFCRRILPDPLPDGTALAIHPVTVYGGLEFHHLEQDGTLILCSGSNHSFHSYLPRMCELPLLTGLLTMCGIAASRNSFESNLKDAIHSHFGKIAKNPYGIVGIIGGEDHA